MPIFSRGYQTQTAGTAIVEVIPAYQDKIPRITRMSYTSAGTAHTIYVMRAVGATQTITGSLSGVSTLSLARSNPGLATTGADEQLAAADYLVWIDENGVYRADTVASISGSVVTMTNALTADVLAGSWVWAFHEIARATHIALKPAVSTTTIYDLAIQAGVPRQQGIGFQSTGSGEPLLVVVNNLTAAGSLNFVTGEYVDPSDVAAG